MDKKELRKFICEVLNIPKITPTIEGQIHRFVMELGVSYKEIAQALVFFLEEEGGTYEEKYGIGILKSVFARSNAHFEKKRKEKEKQIESVKLAKEQPDIVLTVKEIKQRKKRPKIDIENLEIE